MADTTYILITPAKNEAKYITKTINSVIGQILKPAEWIIVNDGSSDSTEEVVRQASARYPWIKLVFRPTKGGHSFDSVVRAIEYGIQYISVEDYAFIGLIDADIQFKPDYFFQLIKKMENEPSIGLAGGMVVDSTARTRRIPRNNKDIPGATQFFRRECFEAIGGIIPVPEGGWDTLTCAQARMAGYETKLYTDLVVAHLRPRNFSQGGVVKRALNLGARDYAVGYHPIFEIVKCLYRLAEPPVLIGSLFRFFGYCFSFGISKKRLVEGDLLRFIHGEQLQRIRGIIRR